MRLEDTALPGSILDIPKRRQEKNVGLSGYYIKTMLKFWITNEKIRGWAESKNIFFILAIGRSGTRFLAELLNQAEGTYVVHEPVREDFKAHQDAFHCNEKARDYIQNFRKKEIYLRACNRELHAYGEVNGILRRHCLALKEAFPKAKLIHLIRDGRDVVRSMMSRKTMTAEDANTGRIYPAKADPWQDKWPGMSRFERICWYWQAENRYLRQSIETRVQLEKIVSSYDYFKSKLLDELGLEISRQAWQEAASIPKNATEQHKISHWREWGQDMMRRFQDICGEEMAENGYEL